MVFYRKYRPQKIKELDSENVREKLQAVLSSRNVPHAFLFTGPKGLGKTSTARIVAKVINCEKLASLRSGRKDDIEPCNKCSQCISITNGSNLDVLEIDGASNRGIDEIRDLREKIRLAPVGSGKKVYIIDEVHMLTQEAFNALLKTLEEPPSHALFILCTTEAHKVPATIISRCFQIIFSKATEEELTHSLKRIVKGEEADIEANALLAIAKLSDGGFREAAKILEEIIALSAGKKITKELVEEKYQISSVKHQIEALTDSLEEKDVKKGLKIISELSAQGVDMKFFLEELISVFHMLLLSKAGVAGVEVKSQKFTIEEIKQLVELFSKAYGELKYAVLPQLPLEIAIIEWTSLGRVPTLAPLPTPQAKEPKIEQQSSTQKSGESPTILSQLIDKMKSHNHSIAGVLRGCSVKEQNNKQLELVTNYKFHKDKLSEPKIIKLIEEILKEITGKDIEFLVTLKV